MRRNNTKHMHFLTATATDCFRTIRTNNTTKASHRTHHHSQSTNQETDLRLLHRSAHSRTLETDQRLRTCVQVLMFRNIIRALLFE